MAPSAKGRFFLVVIMIACSQATDFTTFPKFLPQAFTFTDEIEVDSVGECIRQDFAFVLSSDGVGIKCTNLIKDQSNFIVLDIPSRLTWSEILASYVGEDTLTVYDSERFKPKQSTQSSLPDTLHFVACVTTAFYHRINALSTSQNLGAWIEGSKTLVVNVSENLDLSGGIRLWDLAQGCHDRWYFKIPNLPLPHGPIGNHLDQGVSLFCEEDCRDVQIKYSSESLDLPVDTFFLQSQCVSTKDLIDPPPSFQVDDPMMCLEKCSKTEGAFAMLQNQETLQCTCVNWESMPSALKVMGGCLPCPDYDNFQCGNSFGGFVDFNSVYTLADIELINDGYQYFQCFSANVLDQMNQIMPTSLRADSTEASPAECLAKCGALDLDLVILQSHEEGQNVQCTCTSLFRFPVTRVRRECLDFWCPTALGPCVNLGDPLANSVSVFCRNKACDSRSLLPVSESGVCEREGVGFRSNDPRSELPSATFFECSYNPEGDLWFWFERECEIQAQWFVLEAQSCSPGCEAVDSRGEAWLGLPDQVAFKTCTTGTGEAQWLCNGLSFRFEGSQPDRSQCVDDWISEVQDMVNTGQDSLTITDNILGHVTDSTEITGGTLLSSVDVLEDVLELHQSQITETPDDAKNRAYVAASFEVLDALLGSTLSWEEVSEDDTRFNASSRILAYTDRIGAFSLSTLEQCEGQIIHDLKVMFVDQSIYQEYTEDELVFHGRGVKITVPNPSIPQGASCHEALGVSYAIDLKKTKMFPNFPEVSDLSYDGLTTGLFPTLLDFTFLIQNAAVSLNHSLSSIGGRSQIQEGRPIEIEYEHQFRRSLSPECVFWNFETSSWSNMGCVVDRRRSTGCVTICQCTHLTNFGIIFGGGDADDEIKSIMSIVLGTLSCSCLAVTVFFLHWFRQTSNVRQVVELNRNYCLFIGQALFLTIVGMKDHFDVTSCIIITCLTHLAWMLVFAWTAMEGFTLYRALVVVFDSGEDRFWIPYAVSYTASAIIVLVTLMVALLRGDDYFREDACWLNDNYIWAFKGPVLAVLALNTLVLIIGLKAAYKVGQQRNIDTIQKVRGWARNFMILSYLLGVTWVIGFFNPLLPELEYVFIVLNASSGIFILVYGVICNRRLRETSSARSSSGMRKTWTSTRSTKMSTSVRKESATHGWSATSLKFRLASMKRFKP
eukprot:maker-scaffold1028_size131186-snap-gene-0.43 protein:Tk10627 transcript:maker-scaffold1028_size131186-snap-gene-0.43-mRNA-1 annotation:"CIRL"